MFCKKGFALPLAGYFKYLTTISMKKPIQIKVVPVILIMLFVVSIFASINYYNNTVTKANNNLLVHTQKVLYKSQKVLSVLEDVETGTRGFVITGDTLFLQPYYLSKDSIQANIAALKILTKDNPVQQLRIDTVSILAGIKVKISSSVVQLRQDKNYEQASIIQLLEHGKKVMDKIRILISEIQGEENVLLAIREQIAEKTASHSKKVFFIFLGSILVLIVAAVAASRYFDKFSKTADSTAPQLNTKLTLFSQRIEDVVKGISDPFFSLDKNFIFIYHNHAMQSSIGTGKGHLMGENIFDLFPQYKENIVGEKMRETMELKKVTAFEVYDDFLAQWQDITIYPTSEGIAVYIKDASQRKSWEKELNTTKQLLEETNQVAIVGGWEVDMQAGTVTWTSVTALIHETDAGYKPDLKTSIGFYKEGQSRNTIIQLVNDGAEHGKAWDADLQIITAKGNEKWIRTKGKAIIENGECVRLLGTFQDIDAQKKMADLLQQREQQFENAFGTPLVGMALVNTDRISKEVNQSLCNMIGYSREEFLSTSLEKITHPDDVANDKERIAEMSADPAKSFQYEKRYIHKDGHIVWVILSVSTVTRGDGNILYYVAQMLDITEKKLTEQKLKDERKLLQDIIDNLPLNVYMKDLQSRKTLVNKSEMKYAGAVNEAEILGKTDFELYPQETAAISVAEDIEVFTTKKSILNKATKSVKNDGTETTFLTSKIPFINKQGEVTGLLGISYETTFMEKNKPAVKE